MKRRIIASLLLLTVLLSAMGLASAAGTMQLTAAYPKTAAVGEEFTLEISAANNPGLCAVQITIEYDTAALECISANTGTLMGNMMTASNPKSSRGAIVVGAGTTPYKGDGQVASFKFKVLKADYDSFLISEALFTGENEADIPFTITGLTVKETAPPTPPPTKPENTYQSKHFTDTAGHWAAEYIDKAFEAKLVEGYGEKLFGPTDEMTRAQFITVLWRSEGEPEPSGKASFTDLDENVAWSHKAVAWAEENGLTDGVGGGLFDPYGKLTREQMATILFRKSGGVSGNETMYGGVYDKAFSDSEGVATWAKSAVYWAVYNEIWCGRDSLEIGSALYPVSNASRAEMAVMMVRFQTMNER